MKLKRIFYFFVLLYLGTFRLALSNPSSSHSLVAQAVELDRSLVAPLTLTINTTTTTAAVAVEQPQRRRRQ